MMAPCSRYIKGGVTEVITGVLYATVTVAEADAPFAAGATAKKKCGFGGAAGAMYIPFASIVPALADQMTFPAAPVTVALNCLDEPCTSVTDAGEIATVPVGTTVPIGMSGLLLATLLPLTTSCIVIVTNCDPIGAFAGTIPFAS